jgi:hypothetical protein
MSKKFSTRLVGDFQILLLSGFMGIIVGLPLISSPLIGDEVWAVYLFGSEEKLNLFRIIQKQIQESPIWLEAGNFRPIGRVFEHLGYSLSITLTSWTLISPTLTYGFIRVVMVVLFFVSVSLFILRSPFGNLYQKQKLTLLVICITPGLMLVNDSSGTFRAFPVFYVTALIIVLLSLHFSIRPNQKDKPKFNLIVCFFLGLLGAAYNEVTFIGTIVSVAFLFSEYLKSKFTRKNLEIQILPVIYLAIGSLIIFIPTRIIIYFNCANTECYSPSSVTFANYTFDRVIARGLSALPTFSHTPYTSYGDASFQNQGFFSLVAIFSMLVILSSFSLFVLSWGGVKLQVPKISVMTILGAAIVVTTSLVFSTSEMLQIWPVEQVQSRSWKDSGLLTLGWSLLIGGLLLRISEARYLKLKILNFFFWIGFASISFAWGSQSLILNAGITEYFHSQPTGSLNMRLEHLLMKATGDQGDLSERCLALENARQIVGEPVADALIKGLNLLSTQLGQDPYCKLN